MTGKVITFYSYKGGVGRSFTLANVGYVLAEWGFSVLIVDWDIEAPGLNHYFGEWIERPRSGVVDFLQDCRRGRAYSAQRYITPIDLPGLSGSLQVMLAAGSDAHADYFQIVQKLDWDALYSKHDLGRKLEEIRQSWVKSYDFVLLDSRTGLTDFSGVTTVQLPDILCFMFTANRQSLEGTCEIVRRAMEARAKLPIDRPAMRAVPIPSRFDLKEEYDRGKYWKGQFAEQVAPIISDWVPSSVRPIELVDALTVPHVPRWTFGEEIAVKAEPAEGLLRLRSPQYPVSHAVETVAALLANDFERMDLLFSSRDEYVLTAQERARSKHISPSEPKRVFVTSHTIDAAVAAALMRHLLSEGYAVENGIDELRPGDDWSREIARKIESADAMVAVIGDSADSRQRFQWETFLRSSLRSDIRARPLVPLLLPGADALFFNSRLASLQAIRTEKSPPTELEFAQISLALNQIFQSETGGSARADGSKPRDASIVEEANNYERLGDLARETEDYSGAMARYEHTVALRERVARTRQSDSDAQRALLIAYGKLGEVFRAAGELDNARARYEIAVPIAERLLRIEPKSAQYRRDLANAHEKVGDIMRYQGEVSGAQVHYEQALREYDKLAQDRPPSDQAFRDVAVTSNKLGDIQREAGDLHGAMGRYERAAMFFSHLYSQNAASSQVQRDHAMNLNKLGDIQRELGDVDGAIDRYEASLALWERLAQSTRSPTQAIRDIAVTCNKLGDAQREIGDLAGARDRYEQALSHLQAASKRDRLSGRIQRDVALSYTKLGSVQLELGDAPGALARYEHGLLLLEELAARNPTSAQAQRDLFAGLLGMAEIERDRGEPNKAANLIERALKLMGHVGKYSSDDLKKMRSAEAILARLRGRAGD